MARFIDGFLDILAWIAVIMLILLLIGGVVGCMLYAITEYVAKPACYASTAEMGFDVRWQFYVGCLNQCWRQMDTSEQLQIF